MKSIKDMIYEHENVTRMVKVMRKYSYAVLQGADIDYKDFYKIIDFIRNYTDGYHHAKEEDILFKRMGEELPKLADNGAITGMLIEHDMARLYVSNLEKALEEYEKGNDEARLDIIANTICYGDLLTRHVDKENNVIYKFAERMLSDEVKKEIDRKSEEVDNKASKDKIQEKYLKLLDELENKINN
ncbi:MAG: hemerythrin domain-containing protein [Tissierellia bacterium]|nr:hemerythrin domain-containing protein [Tissierellia bacterium]